MFNYRFFEEVGTRWLSTMDRQERQVLLQPNQPRRGLFLGSWLLRCGKVSAAVPGRLALHFPGWSYELRTHSNTALSESCILTYSIKDVGASQTDTGVLLGVDWIMAVHHEYFWLFDPLSQATCP